MEKYNRSPFNDNITDSTMSLMNDLRHQSGNLQDMLALHKEPTSALDGKERYESLQRLQATLKDEREMRRTSVNAQVESTKLLADQREQTAVMNEAINLLLEHSIKQAKQQAIELHERNKIETKRFWLNIFFTFIAALTGIIALIAK